MSFGRCVLSSLTHLSLFDFSRKSVAYLLQVMGRNRSSDSVSVRLGAAARLPQAQLDGFKSRVLVRPPQPLANRRCPEDDSAHHLQDPDLESVARFVSTLKPGSV